MTSSHRRSQGFTLIEVMIAALVLTTGFLALTALQGSLIQSSADSKVRSQVAAYAVSELDRLRLGGVDAIAASTTLGSAVAATDPLKLAMEAAGLSELRRDIAVTQYVADAAGVFTVNNGAHGTNPYFRKVTVTMSWTDAGNQPRSLSFSTDVSPLALNASKVLVDREPPDDAGLYPIARRPSPVTEGMIPIATGGADGEATAATNPKPKLVGGESGSYVSDTRFDVLTYSRDPYTPDGFVRFNKRIETAVIGCTCQKSTAGFTGGGSDSAYRTFLASRAFRPTYWNGTGYEEPVAATGAVDSSPVNTSQSPLCDVCCRDHKDPAGVSGPKFSPWTGQTADHYRLNTSGTLVLAGTGDTYLETCRIIRVNGDFRVSADPKIQDQALVPTQHAPPTNTAGSQLAEVSDNNSATSPQLSTPGKDAYEDYVYDAVDQLFYSTSSVAAQGNTVNFAALQQSTSSSTSLNQPEYVPIRPTADKRWLHSRILMTDYLEADARTRMVAASTDCDPASTAQQRAQCVLAYVPMATVNTTEISTWAPRAKNPDDTVPAGLATLNPNYLNFAKASIKRYNSGLALFSDINPADGSSPATDEQLFVQLALAAPAPSWLDVPSPNPSTARYFGNPLNPMRGYAQTSAPIPFRANWSFQTSGGVNSPATDSNKANDPSISVVDGSACTPASGTHTSNPYACSATSALGFDVLLAGYNRIDMDENFNNPCGAGKVSKPQCVVYTFTGGGVDTAPPGTIGSSSLYAGTAGKINEVIRVTVPRIETTSQSTVTLNFSVARPETTYTCTAANTPAWTLPCQ